VNIDFINKFLSKIKLQDKINFTKNLSTMVAAGLSLSRALDILQRQTNNLKFKDVTEALSGEINKGGSLSSGMEKIPKVFSSLFVYMVRAGEESGSLAESLKIVGLQLEKSYFLRKKIKGAMMYPSIVLFAMVIIGSLMLVYVVPTLAETFEDLGAELPATTQIIISSSNALTDHFVLILITLSFLVGVFLYTHKTPIGKRFTDSLLLHLPIISKFIKESNAAITARTLSSLLSSGVDMVEAISITKDVLQNSYYKEALETAEKEVQKGLPLSKIFKENENIYPIFVGEMVEVGEETGKLSSMLTEVAIFYESEVDAATKDLSTIIEPILMVVIGVGVGFFAISMISPMYEVMGSI